MIKNIAFKWDEVVSYGYAWDEVEDVGMPARENWHTIDDKGRLSIPAWMRAELGDSFTLTKGIGDECLFIYPNEEWEKMKDKVSRLSLTDTRARGFERVFIGGACDCSMDKQGRILIPQTLRDYAGLKKDVVVVSLTTRYEIWDSERWKEALERFDPATDMEGLGI